MMVFKTTPTFWDSVYFQGLYMLNFQGGRKSQKCRHHQGAVVLTHWPASCGWRVKLQDSKVSLPPGNPGNPKGLPTKIRIFMFFGGFMVCFAWGGWGSVESIYPKKISKKYIDEILRYLKLKYLHNQWNLCLNQLNNGQGPIQGMKKTGATK